MKRKDSPAALLSLITQLGLSLITPLLLCIFLSLWIQRRFGAGDWVIVAGILAGLGSMAVSYFQFYKRYSNASGKDDDRSFQSNKHR